jgi:hypothetical protein
VPRIGERESAGRAGSAEGLWAAVLEDEGEAVRARPQAALSSELELKRGVEPGADGLFFFEPDGARQVALGGCEAQNLVNALGSAGETEAGSGREIAEREIRLGVRGESTEEQQRREADHAAIIGETLPARYHREVLKSSLPQPAA